ncbi:MAG: hypothetical protein JOZ02_02255 [Acidobacteria bacterium]|nr:hypothetical protein [Acidobacteriota bacterium]
MTRLVLASALVLACAALGRSQVLIRIPNIPEPVSKDGDFVGQYREFDGKFWFGTQFLKEGETRAGIVGTFLSPAAVEEFDGRLWFFHDELSADEKGLVLKVGYVSKGSERLEEFGGIEFSGVSKTFIFDDKLWALTDAGLYFLPKGGKMLKRIDGMPAHTDRDPLEAPTFRFQEFDEKLWLAGPAGLFFIAKGDSPHLTRVELPNPGYITGLETFGPAALFVSSTGGLSYLLPGDDAAHPVEGLSGRATEVHGFRGHMLIRDFVSGWLPSNSPHYSTIQRGEEKQYVLEPVLGNFDSQRTTHGQRLLIGKSDCELVPVEEVKDTAGKAVREVREFEGELFVIFNDDSLYNLSDHVGTCCLDSHVDYAWHDKGTAYGINQIGERFYVSTPKGVVVYSLYQPPGGFGYSEQTYAPNNSVVSDVVGSDKHLWFFAGEKGNVPQASPNHLYHLDADARLDADLLPTDSYLRTIFNYLLPGEYRVEGETDLRVRVLNKKGKEVYGPDAVEGLLASWKSMGLSASPDEVGNCSYDFSQVKDVRPRLVVGRQKLCFVLQDAWPNQARLEGKEYRGVPNLLSSLLVLPFLVVVLTLLILMLAPYSRFCHDLIMNPVLRKYGSFGLLPLALTVFPSVRRHVLKRYSAELESDPSFNRYFLYPSPEFHPQEFGRRIEGAKKVLLLGPSGIGKTSYLRHLTRHYAGARGPTRPGKVAPVYVSLASYQAGGELEGLIHDQLQSFGRMSDRELNEWFLKQGGFLIFLDGVNEVADAGLRVSLMQFIERNWRANYICLSSQQDYPELGGLAEVKVKPLDEEKINEYLREKLGGETAREVISEFNERTYQLYEIPRNLDYAVEIKQRDPRSPVPQERVELYEKVLSPIISEWELNGRTGYPDLLYQRAFEMLINREYYFVSPAKSLPEDLINALSNEKYRLLVKLAGRYVFQHDLLRAYLASRYFSLRWKTLVRREVVIDYNWLEMLKFTILSSGDANEVRNLMEVILSKGETTTVVGELFNWLKAQTTGLYEDWEADFKLKFATKNLEELQ